ncbi:MULTISPECIES: flagella accessory protein C [Thermococcus]|uniref:Flagellar protein FlaC n=1 Tax=Thermococcus barossii TaxID=54077 RepID=A0A2Z2MGP2_9EURY|nr:MULTISPECIES: flagella accessory protein C [Thermococcus]ASJ04853.1 flagellar protein FlaC [Thermococcus barossii]NJE76918.1 flagellar protein FlaC [Thermococcus sp. ES12]
MSFSYLKNKFKKKKEGEEKTEDNREIIKLDELEQEAQETAEETAQRKKEEEELITQVMTRINEIENDIPRIKVSIDTLKTQINELREEIDRLDKVIKDVMVLYEIVSQQINPFKDVDSANPLLSEIQELSEEIESLKAEIAQIKSDLRLLVIDGMDLDDLIYEAISEGGV